MGTVETPLEVTAALVQRVMYSALRQTHAKVKNLQAVLILLLTM